MNSDSKRRQRLGLVQLDAMKSNQRIRHLPTWEGAGTWVTGPTRARRRLLGPLLIALCVAAIVALLFVA